MVPPRVRRAAALLAAVTVLAGCTGGREDDPVVDGAIPTTASTSTTSTTLAPPTTTSTTAPPVSLTDPSVRAVVSPTGVLLPVVGREGGGVRVNTPCGRSVVVSNGTPVTSATVVLDPGHGGVEFGAADPRG